VNFTTKSTKITKGSELSPDTLVFLVFLVVS
jgi:hypothetical protein